MITSTITREKNFYPVFIIGLLSLFPLYKYVLQIFPSIITNQLMDEFQLNGVGLGNLAATFYYAYLVTQIFVGLLLDKFNLRWIVSVAILTCALGAFLFSFSHNAFEACLARFLMGVGVAFAPIAYMKVAAIWCPKQHYAFVNGLLATASMAGAVLGESVLTQFINQAGWRQGIFIIALVGFALAFLCIFSIKTETPVAGEAKIKRKDLSKIFLSKQNWWLFIYGGFAFSPLAIFGGLWGNPFLQQAYGLSKSQAADLISLIFIGLAIGSPIIGLLSDYFGQRKKMIAIGTCSALMFLLCALYGRTLPVNFIGLSLFMFGFSLGAYMLVFTIGKEVNPIAFTATVVALINASEAILDSITEPLIGKLLDLHSNSLVVHGTHVFSLADYNFALWLLPFYMLISLLGLQFVKQR